MTYTADYTLTLKDGKKIELLFNSYAYRRYSERKGFELDELLGKINQMFTKGRAVSINDIPELLLAGHESYCKYNNLAFTATDLDAMQWVDDAGGFVNGIAVFAELYTTFLAKLLNIDPDAIEATAEEKKRPVKSVKKVA